MEASVLPRVLHGPTHLISPHLRNELGLHGPPLAPSLQKRHALWYSRLIELPSGWKDEVWLHVGACDSFAEVFLNGKSVGTLELIIADFNFFRVEFICLFEWNFAIYARYDSYGCFRCKQI